MNLLFISIFKFIILPGILIFTLIPAFTSSPYVIVEYINAIKT